MRSIAIALFALVALRCDGRDYNGSALEVSSKQVRNRADFWLADDVDVWRKVERLVTSLATKHGLSLVRPEYIGGAPYQARIGFSARSPKSSLDLYLTSYAYQPLKIESPPHPYQPLRIEIVETLRDKPSKLHRRLLQDLRRQLMRDGLLVKRTEPRIVVTF